jgi:transposase
MDERLQFVDRRLAGEAMAELCREFGISRKTGYRIFDRYQECGVQGLTDRSRRPFRYANQLPFQVENYILNVKREHPGWGARKIKEGLMRRFSGIPIPAKSTIHAVLDGHGLVERRGRLRRRAQGTALSLGQRPNELWCTDYKGELRELKEGAMREKLESALNLARTLPAEELPGFTGQLATLNAIGFARLATAPQTEVPSGVLLTVVKRPTTHLLKSIPLQAPWATAIHARVGKPLRFSAAGLDAYVRRQS